MREKINRLAKGIIDRDIPKLTLRPECFDDVLPPDSRRRYDLIIDTDDIFRLKGLSYCDDPHIGLETRAFMGRRCHIVFYVDTDYLEAGMRIEGSIKLITNAGELSVPYCFEAGRESSSEVRDYLKELRNGIEISEGGEADIDVLGLEDPEADLIDHYPEAEADPRSYAVEAGVAEDMYATKASEDMDDAEKPADPYGGKDAAAGEYLKLLTDMELEDEELLSELCGLLISSDETGLFAFYAYKQAILRDIKLTRLYEYYIYAYPEGLSEQMPKSVLLYFSYDNSLEPAKKACLYKDILLYEEPGSELYDSYEPQIRDYAMASVFGRHIDDKLALIYDRMLYPDMIDKKAAMVLPDILKSHHIHVEDERARFVLLKFPELAFEERYPVRNRDAYVPVYFESTRICFLNKLGREFEPQGSFTDTPMLSRQDLLKRCFEIYPEHPMLQLAAAKRVLKDGVENETEAEILRDAFRKLRLSIDFREAVIRELISHEGGSAEFRQLGLNEYDPELRKDLFEALVRDGYAEEAYLCLRQYGLLEAADQDRLVELCLKLIRQADIPVIKGETDSFFIILCKHCFDAGLRDRDLLSFLAKEYESDTKDMYTVLEAAYEAGAELFELPEKVLSSKLFSRSYEDMDGCFEIYLASTLHQKENIVCAYLTVRCSEYFEHEAGISSDRFFEILYSYVSSAEDFEKLPDIYLLALTKHYQETDKLLPNETELCQKLIDILIGRGLIFRYTKALKKKVAIPKEICERYYIEYHGSREAPPRLYIKISPEDTDFRSVEMMRVYGGIYVIGMVLFVEDELHYMIYDDSVSDKAVQEGTISVRKLHSREEDRYSMLDRMTKELKEDKLEELSGELRDYLLKDKLRRELFAIR